jgi:CheY-like chemotaxis protein
MSTQPGRILIVEDDADIQAALCDLLSGEGYEVDIVDNGADAISMLENGARPCVMLVDLLMPGIVGQELLEYVRDDVRLAAIPVAIVSGSPQLAPAGYQVFRKPLDLRPLLDFVHHGCGFIPKGAPGTAFHRSRSFRA